MRCPSNLVIALALAGALIPARTWAHAQHGTAMPAARSTVAVPPSEIRLSFSDGVEVRFTSNTLIDDRNSTIAAEPPIVDPEKKILVIKLKKSLNRGSYRVNWRIVSVDNHRTSGSFRFVGKP
jgi:methionine-rich copper-binding protein CopC